MHSLLESQLERVTGPGRCVDHPRLCELVGNAYDDIDRERRRFQRCISVLMEEVEELNDELRDHAACLKEQNTRFETALENMSHGLAMFSAERRLIVCNSLFSQVYGLSADSLRPGVTFEAVLAQIEENGVYPKEIAAEQLRAALAASREADPASHVSALADGRIIELTFQSMRAGGWVCTVRDITERQRDHERIYHISRHDALTDLPNRCLFQQTIDVCGPRMSRGETLALLCLDLDHFKAVNDTLGHPIGDALLKQVARRLQESVRNVDMVARLGGDEFAIVHWSSEPLERSTALAARLIEVVSQPYEIGGHQVVIGTSIGIAIGPQDGTDAAILLKHADLALYRAKEDGRGKFRFFLPLMDEMMQARHTLELDIRAAIRFEQFELYYQPEVELQSGTVACCEALIRWNHPTRGIIGPADFVPLAEETGLIVQIGEWVVKRACKEAASWPDQVRVAVNLSPIQFETHNLVEIVEAALQEAGLPSHQLELEITETVLLQDTAATLATLGRLHSLGVRIALDDFGTGYSSLSYLRSFPFDKIKIDKSFLDEIEARPDAIAIVHAVSTLGSSLHIVVTAEGVETEAQLARVTTEGCTEAQGYLISKPLRAAATADFLAGEALRPQAETPTVRVDFSDDCAPVDKHPPEKSPRTALFALVREALPPGR